jgi:FKBP-type peptidyl-prolyl cis-trans isomerase (trigger factor)
MSEQIIKKLDGSRVEIVGNIAAEVWGKYRAEAIKHINEHIAVDGFRKGLVPENILIAKVGEMAVLEEMAELALSKAYLDIIIENKIDSIGKPEIQVTKLAKDNPLEFKIITAVVPEVKLPDYKKLAQKEVTKQNKDDVKVTDKDIDDAILRIRKTHSSHEGHDHEKMSKEEHDKAIEASMPELTDEFVKKLGDFNDVPDFRAKLSSMLAEEKVATAKDKLRVTIADAIAAETKVELPDIMIESELHRTEAQFSADIERMGIKIDDYLKHAGKSMEDIRKEWRPHAEKKTKLQLILNAIAVAENVKPDKKEVEEEVDHILEHYKDADREHAAVYAETVLTNEKVFQFLENSK